MPTVYFTLSGGDQAVEWGMADVLTSQEKVREEAIKLAQEIAESAPLAILSIRATLRKGLAESVQAQTDHENKEQTWQRETEDFKEGGACCDRTTPRQVCRSVVPFIRLTRL